ncbi:MAG: DUF624 domain-containing protein [Lachnospiraceae bacterium]|nr:DUF624 domain-containing protein [Lachnospiraceae bacterium]
MKSLFDIDGPVMRFMTKIAYAVYLNILWFICCLPVFTIGASTTALFYVSLKVAKDEEGRLTKSFFRSFKENFRQATIIWLILLAVGILLGVDGYVFYHMRFDNTLWTLGTAVFYVLLAAYAIILMYIFPLLARFDNTIRAMFKNAIMIGMRFLLCTALMALIYFIMAVVVINFFTPAIIFGEGLCALLCSYLLSNILLLCEEKTEEEENPESASPLSEASEISGGSESSESKEPQWSVKDVHGIAKLGYIWSYYKLQIVIICIFLYIAGYMIYGNLTHKDAVLYTALVNITANDAFKEELTADFLDYFGANVRKENVALYDGLYLTEDADDPDFGYVYASNTKITASIAGGLLDVVVMDKKSFDIFAKRGYLCNIEQFLMQEAPELYQDLQPDLVKNTVIIEDNSVDVQLDSSIAYTSVTDEYPMAVDLSQSELIRKEGFDGTLYLGIIANAPHKDAVVAYLQYLTDSLP